MLGAIIGDTVGSRFEFDNIKTKDFELVNEDSFLTDDSIMTMAVYEILSKHIYDKDEVIDTIKKWGRAYPNRGYGGRFSYWLFSDQRDSYRSFGNGAAMRVSPVGWFARDEEEVKSLSKMVTEVTHSHPEGIKGAEVTAMCVYYARIGKNKEFIRDYARKLYSLDFTYEDLKKNFKFDETCQNTVPQAIYCFLISNSFEDCLRTTISLGGDCDTTAAISCAIAEAYYKDVDIDLIHDVMDKLPKDKEGCEPKRIFREILEMRLLYNASSEDVDKETKVCVLESLKGHDKCFLPFFSKRVGSLRDYICYDVIYQIFGKECDDLTLDSIKEQYLESFIANQVEFQKGKAIDVLYDAGLVFMELEKVHDFESFEEAIKKLNEHLQKLDEKYEIKVFDTCSSAVDYLEDHMKIKIVDYEDIFNQVYKLKVL